MPKPAKTIKAPCNDCARETEHVVLKTNVRTETDENATYTTIHRMIKCCGCSFISLLRIFDGTPFDASFQYFPPPASRRKPKLVEDLWMYAPEELDSLFTEVYQALDSDSRRLSTMGARAILDVMVRDKVGDVGTFAQKLNALVDQDFITKKEREFLQAALEVGHAASHRGHCPSASEVNLLMNIVESVVIKVYVLPETGEELKKTTPPKINKKAG